MAASSAQRTGLAAQISAGLLGGLVGGATIWIYELVVQSLLMKTNTPYQLVENTAVLCFGPGIRALGVGAFALGLLIHFATALVWGVVFALIWPPLAARRIEATLAALFFGVFAWGLMHNVLLAMFSPNPPSYNVLGVINGFMSHTWGFAVPLALTVKGRLTPAEG
jgi:uncharacterized membrane protein YagU involved in acid resistance